MDFHPHSCEECKSLILPDVKIGKHIFDDFDARRAKTAKDKGCELFKWILEPLSTKDKKRLINIEEEEEGKKPMLEEYKLFCVFSRLDETHPSEINEFGFHNPRNGEEICRRMGRLVLYDQNECEPDVQIKAKETFTKAREWLDSRTESEHHHCQVSATQWPDLLVKIDHNDGRPDEWTLSLRNGEQEKADYAALTYSWGGEQNSVTTSGNLADRRNAIAWDSLSKTIQDAIKAAWGLGISYIWVDSQCILQGDINADDAEKRKDAFLAQADIYSNAKFTIAASRAQNNGEGFLDEIAFRLLHHSGSGIESVVLWRLNAPDEREPIYKRGWTFQEYKLSRRMVLFESYQIRMICCCNTHQDVLLERYSNTNLSPNLAQVQRFEDEDGKVGTVHYLNSPTRDQALHELQYKEQILQEWYRCVEMYSRRELTSQSDKVPAILGLAIMYMKAIGHRLGFPSGIFLVSDKTFWKKYPVPVTPHGLSAGLLWTMQTPQPGYQLYNPTWSWVSSASPLNTTYVRTFLTQQLDVDVLEVKDELLSRIDPMNIFGRIIKKALARLESESITLKGPILKAKLGGGSEESPNFHSLDMTDSGIPMDNLSWELHMDSDQMSNLSQQYGRDRKKSSSWQSRFSPLDEPANEGDSSAIAIPVVLLRFYPKELKKDSNESIVGLVLREVKPNYYVRIGVFKCSQCNNTVPGEFLSIVHAEFRNPEGGSLRIH